MLACWQVGPGISYGIMTGKEEEHLELPGEAFNLAVLPANTGCFSALGALLPFFLPLRVLPLFPPGLWSLAVGPSEGCGLCSAG